MFKHLLVPTDGTPLSQQAVSRAISFAREAGARITFFSAEQRFPTLYCGEGAISDAHLPTRYHEEVDCVAHEIVNAAEKMARQAGVDCCTLVLVSDSPSEAIIKAAKRNECDLIFMASHGHSGIRELLLGGETQQVLMHSRIPVLVHRPAQP